MTIALVSLTGSFAPSGRQPQGALLFTEVHCPKCNRRVMSVPGSPIVEPRAVTDTQSASGRGRLVRCAYRACHTLVEVIEHRP